MVLPVLVDKRGSLPVLLGEQGGVHMILDEHDGLRGVDAGLPMLAK
jgi:hypothetical protein